MSFITENLGFISIAFGVLVFCVMALIGIVREAKKNATPEPTQGMGDQPAWLRNGEEERGPHGNYTKGD